MVERAKRSLLIFFVALALASCERGKDLSQDEIKKNNALVVGGVLSLTGGAAAYGSDAKKGAILAKEIINRKDEDVEVEFICIDDKSDKTEAARVARQLVDIHKVNIILGPAISPSALSVGKLCEERGIPMVATSATQDEVTAADSYNRQFVFRVCFNDSFQGRILAHFAAKTLNKKTAIIVYDKTLSYSIGLAKTFREDFEAFGGSIKHVENYSVRDTDYSVLIDKVARIDADILFIPGWDENVGPMLKQAGNKWDKFVLLGGDAWPSNRLLELAGGNIKNAYAVSHFLSDDPDLLAQEFSKSYIAKYNEKPSPFAALGYDAMMLIYDAAKRAGSQTAPELKKAITTTECLKLVTGEITFDEFRNPQKDVIIVKILPDKIEFFKRIKL